NLPRLDIIVNVRQAKDIDILRSGQKPIRYVIVDHEQTDLITKLRPDFDDLLAVDPEREVSPLLEQLDISGNGIRGPAEDRLGDNDYDSIARMLEVLQA